MFDFFIHFDDKTGEIITVTNEEADAEHAVLKVPYSEVEKFMSGAENFINYKISLKDKTKFKLVKRSQLANYVSNAIQVVTCKSIDNPDLTIKQDLNKQQWTLILSQHQREELEDSDLNFQLIFYVVDCNNLNKMFRKFIVDTVDLVDNMSIDVKFAVENETTESVVLVTDKFFKQYKMEVCNEQD